MSTAVTRPSTSNPSARAALDLSKLADAAWTHASINGWLVLDVQMANKWEKAAPALEISRVGDRPIRLWCRGERVEISKVTQELIDHFEGCGFECIVMRPENVLAVAERLARPPGWTPPSTGKATGA